MMGAALADAEARRSEGWEQPAAVDLADWHWLLLGSEHLQAQAEDGVHHGPLSFLALQLGRKSGLHCEKAVIHHLSLDLASPPRLVLAPALVLALRLRLCHFQ